MGEIRTDEVKKQPRREYMTKILPRNFAEGAPLDKSPEVLIEWMGGKIQDLEAKTQSLEPGTLLGYVLARERARQSKDRGDPQFKQDIRNGIVLGYRMALDNLELDKDAALLDKLYEESCTLCGIAKPALPKLPSP